MPKDLREGVEARLASLATLAPGRYPAWRIQNVTQVHRIPLNLVAVS